MGKRALHCVECGKEIAEDEDAYMALDNWLQWHYYTKYGPNGKVNCFCSPECFADSWMLEAIPHDEFEFGENE